MSKMPRCVRLIVPAIVAVMFAPAALFRVPGEGIRTLARAVALLLPLAGLAAWSGDAMAAAKFSRANANWNVASTWSDVACGGAASLAAPTAADVVTICNRNTVTVNAAGLAANSVTVAGTSTTTTLTFAAGSGLTVTNNVTINAPTTSNRFNRITVLTGALTVGGNVTLTGGTVATRDALLSASTGSITINGGLTVNATVAGSSTVSLTGAGTITVNGAAGVANGDTVTIGTGTFNVTNAAASFTNSSATNVATTTLSTGTLNVAGNLTNAAAETLTVSSTGGINLGGNWSNGGTFNRGTGTVTFNGAAAQDIGGAAVSTFNNLTVSNGAAPVSASTNFSVNGTLTVNANAVLQPAAAVVAGGTGTLTGTGTVQVTRTAAVADFSSQYTITTKMLTNLTVEYIGAAAQTVSALTYGSATGGGLKVNNASGVNLAANTTVAGTLTLASGVVNAGAFTLIGSGDCTTKMLRTGGHVAGNLQLQFPTGAPSCTFHVGDATTYRPVAAAFASVSVAGPLVGAVSQAAGDHPSIASSGLDATKSVNRFWTITDPVGGTIAYTSYSATFNFLAGDYDVGATPGNFEAEFWDGAAWTITTVGTQAATSNQATAIARPNAANTYAAFAVAEKIPPPTVVSIVRADANPTSAATVSWTVTFSKSVTGVDVTDFALAATGVSGAFVSAVTGATTTWTVTANTGIGSGTLGLNLADDDTIIDAGGRKLGGTGAGNGDFTGELYTITSTPALAEYRMDEAGWNGTANEAIDSGAGGFNGTAAGLTTKPTTSNTSPAIVGNPGTCRYGVFNRSNKDYLALAGFPNLAAAAGDFTITAWINVADNTLPGQRIFIDDETNTSPGGWGFSVGETAAFGVGGLRFYYRQPSVYTLDTVPIPSNQWLFVALTVRLAAGANASSATIYAWDTAGTLVTSNTGTFTWVAGSDPGPSSIGGETNASGEGTNAFGFGGNLDEVRVYQKALSQAALAAIAAQTHACPINIPDHLEIHSGGTGVTCTPSTLTVVACADAACTTPYTLGVSGTLSVSGTPTVNWDGTTGGAAGAGFDIPVGGSSVTKDVQVTTPGSVVFGISAAAPAPANPVTCNFGAPACTFTAANAGFLVSAPDHVAETAPTLTVQAVKKADNSLVCVPAFASVSKTVNLKCAYVNPASGTLPARVGGAALNAANNAAAACDGAGSNVSLSFNASGIATPTLQYADVGNLQIDASYAGAGLEAGLSMTGSGTFIAAPASFAFSGITAGPIKAGNDFSATVTAKNSAGNTTPNFGQEGEGVTLTPTLVSPLGGANPALANGSIVGGTFSNGAAAVTNLGWGDVGNITLDAALTSGSYLGSGLTASGTSATVGAFIPDHLDTVVVATAVAPMPCPAGLTCPTSYDGIIYSGQPFSVQVTARNLAGGPTANYDGTLGFSKGVTLTAWDALGSIVTQNPGGGAVANGSVNASDFNSGKATTATPTYTFPAAATAPTDIYVRAVDADSVSSRRTSPATSVEGGVKVVSGRIRIGSAHGSELLRLPMTATVQYYSGAYWATSATDDTTSFNTNLSTSGGNLVATIVSGLGGGIAVNSPGIGAVVGGVRVFRFSAPGVRGSANISLNAPTYLPSNTARATFGVYKGANEFIYMRENY